MMFKRILPLICLVICLFAMASVCASDANDTTIISENSLDINQTTDDVIGVGEDTELAFPDENNHADGAVMSSESNSNPILNQSDSASDVLGDSDPIFNVDIAENPGPGHFTIIVNTGKKVYVEGDTFADIQDTIYSSLDGDAIVLTGGKTYFGNGDYISVNNHLTITSEGGNAILDAQNLSRILHVCTGCEVTVENIDFINGRTTGFAGAIAWLGPNGSLRNCNFISNSATTAGGAVFWGQNDGTMENCNFINNSAAKCGAVFIWGYRNKIINCNFTNNHADDYGGALYLAYDDNEIINCNFRNNSALSGGAIRSQGNNDKVRGCYFVQNSASVAGAIFWRPYDTDEDSILGGNYSLSNCVFVNNSATSGYGGAVLCVSDDSSIWHSNFTDNSAVGDNAYGGAVCTFARNVTIGDCIFRSNSASLGGAVAMGQVSVCGNLITDCTFIGNFAGGNADDIRVDYSNPPSTVVNCNFKHKANSTALNLNDENLCLIFDLEASLNYKNFYGGYFNGNYLYFWDGESYVMKNMYFVDECFSNVRGINQSIILEIYNSADGLVANVTGLTDSFGQIAYDYRSLPDGQYTYRAYHPDSDDFSFILKEGSFERSHIPTEVSISVSNVTYPGPAVASITASSPGTYKLVIAGTEYDNITFTYTEISNGGGKATKTVNVNLLEAKDNYDASVTYEMSDEYYGASNQTRFNVYKAGTSVDVNETIGYFSEDIEIACRLVNATAVNMVRIRNNSGELVEGRDYSIISNENGRIIMGGLAIGAYAVNLTAGLDGNHYSSSKEFTLTIKPSVDLSIDVAASNQTPFYGDTIAYTITVANNGPNVAEEVIVTYVIPEGMNVSSQDASYMGNGIWNITSIGAGSENAVTLTLYATLNNKGSFTSGFNVASNEHDKNIDNNNAGISVNVIPISNLNVVILANAGSSIRIDDLVTYTVTVANKGPCDVAGTKVTGHLSKLLRFISAKASAGSYDRSANVWNIGNLSVNDSANLTLTFRVISDGAVKNTFDVGSDVYDFDTSDNSVNSVALSAMKISTAFTCKNMVTTAIDISADGKRGQYYSLILRDAKNNLLVGKTVKITINKVVYTVKTGSNGVARLQVNIKKMGTYTADIKFAGDGKYLESSASVKIKVNKQKPKIISSNKKFLRSQNTKKITATLKTSRGKTLKGKSMVFVIKGKKYKAKTNSKGIATVKVKLTKKGKYTCSIKYAGDATYSTFVKKIRVVIK